jgi:hypothetical protein
VVDESRTNTIYRCKWKQRSPEFLVRGVIVTANTFLEKAKETQLSNDDMMKLSEDRVSARSNVIHLSTNKFWQTMTLESGHQLILLAKSAMPRFHKMMYVKKKYMPRTKTYLKWEEIGKGDAMDWIKLYNKKCKNVSTLIYQYLYGVGKSIAPKNERLVSKEDLLLTYEPVDGVRIGAFYNVHAEEAWQQKDMTPPAVIKALSTFCNIDPHYSKTTNTTVNSEQQEMSDDESDSDSDSEDTELED